MVQFKLLRASSSLLPLLLLSRFSRVQLCMTHRRQPTRLPHPWDSPGKNTGVGCHFLLHKPLESPIIIKYYLDVSRCLVNSAYWWYWDHTLMNCWHNCHKSITILCVNSLNTQEISPSPNSSISSGHQHPQAHIQGSCITQPGILYYHVAFTTETNGSRQFKSMLKDQLFKNPSK